MKRMLHKVKTAAGLVRQYPKIQTIIEDREKYKQEKIRYFTERQILFDQSQDMRIFLANKYISGKGIEIGPAEHPLALPHEAKATFVDEISTEDLIKLYPYLAKHQLVNIDVVDDGQSLAKFKDHSQNFVIANHFLEHVINPIKAIENFYRVLKPGGVIFMAIPDKRLTFDKNRPVTPLSRLISFYNDPKKAEAGKWPMFLESAEFIEGEKGPRIKKRAQELYDEKFSIHLNVWAQHDVAELVLYCINTLKLDLDFETVMKNQHEFIVILSRNASKKVSKYQNKTIL